MARRFEISSNHVYWLVVAALAGCTLFFASSVEQRRAQLRTDHAVEIESGTAVSVVRVIDGDTISVRTSDGENFVVRLVGVKGFSTSVNEPGLSGLGQAAVANLERIFGEKEIRLVFDELKTDRSGRVLGYLEADGDDVAVEMIRKGQLVVYNRFPFSREEIYRGVEAEARTNKTGLWGNYKAVSRVQGWQDTWKTAREAEAE